ncbi:C4-dicarboxylate ABC transporter [Clostridium sp. chh4-2]|uniref:TRAP transporter substrate-binding protein DctP n=1 Tax=Clostridium sp. chh4-2 TaxID=2067550 RepID=UPI000CCF9A5C|nr:TRAP transporter substrate-binding protein DctP [Clostridium sp. chh4-2]PNV61093.1 C4-dicarboxylate ABC transporter [Clostridium sp. chh4-2]
MKNVKKTLGIVVTVAAIAVAGSIFVSVSGVTRSDKIQLKMSHNQSKDSEIADCIAKVAEFAAEDPSMNLEVDIYASGVLGTEQSAVEMVKAGVLDMAKVSSSMIGQFNDCYSIFSLPYLFTSEEHYYEAMEKSEKVKELFKMNEEDGFLVIGYYANGSRNIYLKEDVKADNPSVLKGKKIRSMTSSTSMRMLELMGASPTPMAASETYTALQQGIVDGAENTELALTVDKHAEVAKSYTYTEHQYTPDVYIISTKTWNKLSKEQQEFLVECLNRSNENFKSLYRNMMEEAIEEAKGMGMNIYYDIDKTAFIEAVQPLHQEYTQKGEFYKELYDDIQKYAGEDSHEDSK